MHNKCHFPKGEVEGSFIVMNKEKHTKIDIAHRGLWNESIPENSIPAFEECIKKEVAIELDVHLLECGTVVVFHDDDLKRMTGIDGKIRNYTYDEIKDLPLKGTVYHIPTLKNVLDLVKGKVLLDIEIKTDVKNFKICASVAKLLDDYEGDFIIKSFSPFHIAWFRFKRPSYKRGLLVSSLKKAKMPKVFKWALHSMKFNFLCKPQFIAYDYRDLPDERIDKLYRKGMPIYLWTIKGNEVQAPYDGIIYELQSDKKE